MKFTIEKSLPILERTPVVIEALLGGLDKEWLMLNEGENTWSPFDVVGHLIQGEKEDWIPRMRIILSDDADKKFIPFDRFKQLAEDKGKSASGLIAEFKMLRAKNLEILKNTNLNETSLNRTGIHPAFGEVTLRQLLATWVTHDLGHLTQITRVMAKQYKDEIGPWTAYFNVFK